MYARVEVGIRPGLTDPGFEDLKRRFELAYPALASKMTWGRLLDLYLLNVPCTRDQFSQALSELFYDPVLNYVFTGGVSKELEGPDASLRSIVPNFESSTPEDRLWGIERTFRPGVTDNVGRTATEALEIVLPPDQTAQAQIVAASGNLFIVRGELERRDVERFAKAVFCNELIENFKILSDVEIFEFDRFHADNVKAGTETLRMSGAQLQVPAQAVETFDLASMSDDELLALSKERLLALNLEEMRAIRQHFSEALQSDYRRKLGLGDLTDVELEVLAQTWSEHCKHKLFSADWEYESSVEDCFAIPAQGSSLFKKTIVETTKALHQDWLLSVFSDNAGIVAFDEEDAICIKVETHNSPSALDPYGGALTGIVGVNRDILGCGLGARPIFNTDVFCVAPLDTAQPIPDQMMHPRRILEGIRKGVEHGGNKSGIPTVNGAVVFDDRFLGKPLVYCGTGGMLPRQIAGRACETKEIFEGDLICMIGGRIGKDGIHGATFSSLALDESSPLSAVQLGDPITQKRVSDFLMEARDEGLYRAITDNGAGGLSSSIGEMAELSGGARLDVAKAKTKYAGLKPYELVISESQERMSLAVSPDKLDSFLDLANRRSVEVSVLGEFTSGGTFDVYFDDRCVASLDMKFLHEGVPTLKLKGTWDGIPAVRKPSPRVLEESFEDSLGEALLGLIAQPNIASKEWMIRQYDHEVQGSSVVKPLHTVWPGTAGEVSGPNDGAVLKPKFGSQKGVAVGSGIQPRYSDVDSYLMAQMAVDEAIRNTVSVGAEYGTPESVLCLVDNFCWPDPVNDTAKAGALIRACYGLREACLELGVPLVSGKDSMKNDFHGKVGGEAVSISVPPTLLMTAMGRVPNVLESRTSDFKAAGDVVYVVRGGEWGLLGSEFENWIRTRGRSPVNLSDFTAPKPDWEAARKIYKWLSGSAGTSGRTLKSCHDLSDGGLLVAVGEGLMARRFGLDFKLPKENLYRWAFGEGFHSFIVSVDDMDAPPLEAELNGFGIQFERLGQLNASGILNVGRVSFDVTHLNRAWRKEEYWL